MSTIEDRKLMHVGNKVTFTPSAFAGCNMRARGKVTWVGRKYFKYKDSFTGQIIKRTINDAWVWDQTDGWIRAK